MTSNVPFNSSNSPFGGNYHPSMLKKQAFSTYGVADNVFAVSIPVTHFSTGYMPVAYAPVSGINVLDAGTLPAMPWIAGIGGAPYAAMPSAAAYPVDFNSMLGLAQQGNLQSQYGLGQLYTNGYGVPQDFSAAMNWYQQAARQNFAPAQYGLGQLYSQGLGVPQDFAAAAQYYQQAAGQGLPQAQYGLGQLYSQGLGVPQNYGAALNYLTQAAGQGLPQAQFGLGQQYAQGLGVPQDLTAALSYFQQAAGQGLPQAQYGLAQLLAQGVGGQQPDLSAVLRLLQQAGGQGYTQAQFDLAQLYQSGTGTQQNPALAAYWAQQGLAGLGQAVQNPYLSGPLGAGNNLDSLLMGLMMNPYGGTAPYGQPNSDILSALSALGLYSGGQSNSLLSLLGLASQQGSVGGSLGQPGILQLLASLTGMQQSSGLLGSSINTGSAQGQLLQLLMGQLGQLSPDNPQTPLLQSTISQLLAGTTATNSSPSTLGNRDIDTLLQSVLGSPYNTTSTSSSNANNNVFLALLASLGNSTATTTDASTAGTDNLWAALTGLFGSTGTTSSSSALSSLFEQLLGGSNTSTSSNNTIEDIITTILNPPTSGTGTTNIAHGDPHFNLSGEHFDFHGNPEAKAGEQSYIRLVDGKNVQINGSTFHGSSDTAGANVSLFHDVAGKLGKTSFSFNADENTLIVGGKTIEIGDTAEAIDLGNGKGGTISRPDARTIEINDGQQVIKLSRVPFNSGSYPGLKAYINIDTQVTATGLSELRGGIFNITHVGLSKETLHGYIKGGQANVDQKLYDLFKVADLNDFAGQKLPTGAKYAGAFNGKTGTGA